MRVSKSFVRLAPGPRTGGSPHDQPPRRRSSFDNLVIPNRTRLPSSRISQVEPIDLAVARNLLDAAAQGPDMAASGASDPSEPRDSYDSSFTESDQQGTQSSSAGEFYIRQHSRTTSWAGNELLPDSYEDQPRTGSSSSVDWRHYELGMSHDGPHDFATGGSFVNLHMPLSTRVGNVDILRAEPDKAASRYNALATANGLAPFQVTQDYVSHTVQKHVEPEASTMGRIKSAVRRSPSSLNLSGSQSLSEKCQSGGCNPLKLPADFSPSECLEIPRSLAAMGSYIVENGPLIPGIFREEGSGNITTELVQHYDRLSRRARGTQLPSRLDFTVLEVATAYKRVIKSLPGALLGSLELLGALRNISLNVNQDGGLSESEAIELRAHMIALALSCVQSDHRFSVICATLGLYAWIGHATEASEGGPANMSCRNLSRILGPLLVGDELNDIRDGITTSEKSPPDPEKLATIQENNASAIQIALMLITNWKHIVKELRTFAADNAANLLYEEEGRRLANAQSMYELSSGGTLVQGRQPSDVLDKSAVAGKIKGIVHSASVPIKNGTHKVLSYRYDPVHKPKGGVTKPKERDGYRYFDSTITVKDGTNGPFQTRRLPYANDGHKTRAATYLRVKDKKPQTKGIIATLRSKFSPSPPGPQKEIPAADGPIVPRHSVNKAAGHRHPGPQEEIPAADGPIVPRWPINKVAGHRHPGPQEQIPAADGPIVPRHPVNKAAGHRDPGAVNGYGIKSEEIQQPRLGPTYETHDQPEDDFGDEEIPSEARLSDYGYLLSTPSKSDGGDLSPRESFHDGDGLNTNGNRENEGELDELSRNDWLQQSPYTTTMYRELRNQLDVYNGEYNTNPARNIRYQEDLASYEHRPAPEALGPPTATTTRAQASPVSGSTPPRIRTAPFRSFDDDDAITGKPGVGHENGFIPKHARSETANSVTSSQSGSVRQLAQRFEAKSQGHYVPPWMNVKPTSSLVQKEAAPKLAAGDEAPSVISTDSYSDLPYVENFEDIPTPRGKTATDAESSLALVKSLENTPTPRARSLIPKPLSDIGRVRRKVERRDSLSPSAQKYPGPADAFQQRPPIYQAPVSKPKQYSMSRALHPADVRTQPPLLPIRFGNPSDFFEDPPSAEKVEPSKDLSKRMTTQASSSRSSALQLDQTFIDDIPTRPMTIGGNNTFTHNRAGSQFSQPHYNVSQNGDEYAYSASEYTEGSANMDGFDDDRQVEPMEYIQSAEGEIADEDLAHRQRISEETNEEEYLRRRLAKYDEFQIERKAYYLQLHGRPESVRSMTSQEYFRLKKKTRAEQRMDLDTSFLINNQHPLDSLCLSEPMLRRDMQPFIDKVRAMQKPKSEATLEDLEKFKKKIERCRLWHQMKLAQKEAAEAAEKAAEAEKILLAAEEKKEKAEFDVLPEEEQQAWLDRKAREKLEKICKEADQIKAAQGEHRWSRKRKGSGEKSGDSGESKIKGGVNGTRGGGDGGKSTVLKKLFGGAIRKRS